MDHLIIFFLVLLRKRLVIVPVILVVALDVRGIGLGRVLRIKVHFGITEFADDLHQRDAEDEKVRVRSTLFGELVHAENAVVFDELALVELQVRTGVTLDVHRELSTVCDPLRHDGGVIHRLEVVGAVGSECV